MWLWYFLIILTCFRLRQTFQVIKMHWIIFINITKYNFQVLKALDSTYSRLQGSTFITPCMALACSSRHLLKSIGDVKPVFRFFMHIDNITNSKIDNNCQIFSNYMDSRYIHVVIIWVNTFTRIWNGSFDIKLLLYFNIVLRISLCILIYRLIGDSIFSKQVGI